MEWLTTEIKAYKFKFRFMFMVFFPSVFFFGSNNEKYIKAFEFKEIKERGNGEINLSS